MADYSEYESQADTVKIEDITSNDCNAKILRRLKGNDPSFTNLWFRDVRQDYNDFVPSSAYDAGWLGYFVGENTKLVRVTLSSIGSKERSIRGIKFIANFNLLGGEVFQLLDPLFKHNHNLSEFKLDNCDIGSGRHLSLAFERCKSLKKVALTDCGIGDEQFADIAMALRQTKLESLRLDGNRIGRNGCIALAALIRQTSTSDLVTLDLHNNDIDDDGLEALVGALVHHKKFEKFYISGNPLLSRGLRLISTLLESPSTNLKNIYLNGFGDEEAIVYARALASNRKLQALHLRGNHSITSQGWGVFTRLLCDISNINETFQSNHTLRAISCSGKPFCLRSFLQMNTEQNKTYVAMRKILEQHVNIDMKPLFEWELKTLIYVARWFERAAEGYCANLEDIKCRKLSAIYQFVRAMPVLYVEARTGKNQTNRKRKCPG